MKNRFIKLLAIFILSMAILPFFCYAQETQPKAVAGTDRNVAVGRKVLFSGASSTCPDNCQLLFDWDFGDGDKSSEIDPAHIYQNPGTYRVSLTVSSEQGSDTDEIIISVEKEINMIISDKSLDDAQIENLKNYASSQKILLVSLKTAGTGGGYKDIQDLTQQMLKQTEDIKQANLIIVKTEDNAGLNALSELAQAYSTSEKNLKDLGFSQKVIVVSTSQSFSAIGRIAQSTFNLLRPEFIAITSDKALTNLAKISDADDLVASLKSNNLEYKIIGSHTERTINKLSPLNFLSYITSYLVNKGISLDTIFLILILPVIATIVALARQLIGIKAFGIYIPSIVALTFIVTGLKYGLAIFLAILVIGTIARVFAKQVKLLYLPRMAIVVTIFSFTILAMFILGARFNKTGFLAISIFPILILTVLTERFIEAQIEKGFKIAIRLTIETLALSIVSYFIVTLEAFKLFILAYPEIILITIVINIIIGRFAGLRLLEYFRFKNVIKHLDQTPKE